MPYSDLTPDDLTRRVGRSGMRVRKLLRQMYPKEAPGSGGRWLLTEEQVAAVSAYFAHGSLRVPSGPVVPGTTLDVSLDVPTDWYWEGHVQDAVVRHLAATGWTITAQSDTAARARGDDIAASKDGRRLVVEVKGYPSVGYRDPRRAGEVKRTNPTLQAWHWFADALLKSVRLRGMRPGVDVAMAFPEAPRYRTLVQEVRLPLRALGIGVFFVHVSGDVEEVVATGSAPT